MTRNRAALLTVTMLLSAASYIQTVAAAPPTTDAAATPAAADAAKPAKPKKAALPTQASLASKTATFGAAAEPDVKTAIDAHDLAKVKTMEGKSVTLVGTVAGVYAPKSNKIVILNFDKDYKTAVSVVVSAKEFSLFPDLKTLSGKKVLVTGTVKAFNDSDEVMLDKPAQVKIAK